MNRLLALILAFALVPTFAAAQTYPQRPVHMIVPFAPGGATDALGRLVAYFLSQRLGEQVIVENRPGGGGVVGAEVASRAAPDGYTVLLGSAESFGMTEAIRKRLTYNPEKAFVPVIMVARAPNVFIVHPSVPVNNVKELIEYARKNPEKVRFGSPGIGSNPHLIGELFADRFKIKLVHVPYKGGGAGVNDIVSGQLEMLITSFATAAPRVKAGQVRGLALTSAARTPLMPDVPTMAEAGVDEFVLGALFGLFVPTGTPANAIDRLQRDMAAAMQIPDFRTRLVNIGQEITEPLTGENFGRVMSAEAERWRKLATMAGVTD